MEGDIIALDIRYGIVDRNTLRGAERFSRLDQALTATDPLAAEFFTGKAPDSEDQRRLTDRLSALASRRRAADAVTLYETLLARDIPVPLWAERDIAGSYLELRRPQEALALYQRVVADNPDDFDANRYGQSARYANYPAVFNRHPALVRIFRIAAVVSLCPALRGARAFRPDDMLAVVDIDDRRVVCCRKSFSYSGCALRNCDRIINY